MKQPPNNGSQAEVKDYQRIHFPSLLEGMASVTDLHGILSQTYFERFFSINDHAALYSDWEKVGGDLWKVLLQNKVEFLKNASLETPRGEIMQKALEESLYHMYAQQT